MQSAHSRSNIPIRAAATLLALCVTCLFTVNAGAQASGTAESTTGRTSSRCSEHPRKVHRMQVSHLGCSMAIKAVRHGTFEATPGGLLFSTSGFTCQSPIAPPPAGSSGPRFTFCGHRGHAFRFTNDRSPPARSQ
jgi:hypothetical protein